MGWEVYLSEDERDLHLYGIECTCGRRHSLKEVRDLIQAQGYTLVKTSDVLEAQGRIEELEMALMRKKPVEPFG